MGGGVGGRNVEGGGLERRGGGGGQEERYVKECEKRGR
jgi:hypothetical protein